MDKKKVLIIFGGRSSEHEVSCRSAMYIIKNMPEKYETVTVGITKDGRWLNFCGDADLIGQGLWETDKSCRKAYISPDSEIHGLVIEDGESFKHERIDIIFPVLHGKNGEDGTIQGLFELSGIPYVGCGTLASAVCMDKAVTHTLLSGANIEQAHYLWFYKDRYIDSPETAEKIRKKISARLSYPLFVKPANAGSSVGISKVKSEAELTAAITKAAAEDKKIVVEEGIVGQEVECAVLGGRDAIASTVGEIGASAEFYDYDDKYNSGSSVLYIPARLTPEKIEEIRGIAVRAYKTLGCEGLSRVDFFVKEDGTVILNEINTLPGFTSISMYPKLWEYEGVKAETLVDRLLECALNKFC